MNTGYTNQSQPTQSSYGQLQNQGMNQDSCGNSNKGSYGNQGECSWGSMGDPQGYNQSSNMGSSSNSNSGYDQGNSGMGYQGSNSDSMGDHGSSVGKKMGMKNMAKRLFE
jgi:hypothetical protein